MTDWGDLRDTPRRSGDALAAVGVRIERLGIWIQSQADELRYRKASAWRRWGQ